jgi:hypothetical protein
MNTPLLLNNNEIKGKNIKLYKIYVETNFEKMKMNSKK